MSRYAPHTGGRMTRRVAEALPKLREMQTAGKTVSEMQQATGLSEMTIRRHVRPTAEQQATKARVVRPLNLTELHTAIHQLAARIIEEPCEAKNKNLNKLIIQLTQLGVTAHKKLYGTRAAKAMLHDLIQRLQ